MRMVLTVSLPASLCTRAYVQAAWQRWNLDDLVAQALREYLEHAESHRRDVRRAVDSGRSAQKEGT